LIAELRARVSQLSENRRSEARRYLDEFQARYGADE